MNPCTLPFRPRLGQDILLSGMSPTKSQDSRSQVNCRFYQRGLCRNGHNCPYRHEEADHEDSHPSAKPIVKSSTEYTQPVEEKVTRNISGALVRFDAGAAITKVVFTSDLSAVQLTGLPRNSTHETVLDLLRSWGADTGKVSPIRMIPGGLYSSARVEAEDPRFAQLVVAQLGQRVTSQQGAGIHATQITPETFSTSDSSALRVDCKKIHCSWHKPSKTVWLNFGTDIIARRVCERFKRGEYKILDQKVHPADPQRGTGRFNPKAWTVCLTDVPSEATEANISRAIWSVGDKPRGIELGKPTYSTDAETCASQIQSLFTAIGPLEWWEFTPDTTGKRMKASARFSREEDAKEAVTAFHNSSLPFLKTAKLTVQLVYCARFKVSSLIYDTVEHQIKANIPRWKAQFLHFTAYEQPQPPKWYRTLKIEGEDSKSVADAKNVISETLAGIVAKEGSSVLWQSSLRSNGETSSQLAELQQRTGVVILRNKAKSQIRLFGPPNQCEEVQTEISKILNDQRSKDFAIELGEEKFLWARLGGYKKLALELGADSVSLDITSTPKRIIITGTVGKYEAALSIINGRIVHGSKLVLDGQDCSACWTAAENPIRTRCGHTFCLDCFENLCLSAPTTNSAVEIRCVGDSDRCDTVLDLPQLQEHLSSSAFEELLQQSFASYARLHPDVLRYCPSPDCDYVYRVNGPVKILPCHGCLVLVCTNCNAPHDRLSCAEYQDVSSGRQEANERLKREMGIKDCPKCKTPLEKTEGCNHMTCTCGAHICWVCLETFDSSPACYDHLNKKHGGVFVHYQQMFG
ncbi:hypothetical protein GGR51DRAFT_530958 [Nemania sp. FL0031]|nr:hypothetical protein GGR51DRAFT_530958 [Nemania sp. FL0031]